MTDGWRDILCSWIGIVNIIRMTVLPKAIQGSVQSLSDYPWHFSQEYNKVFKSLYCNTKDPK